MRKCIDEVRISQVDHYPHGGDVEKFVNGEQKTCEVAFLVLERVEVLVK